MNHAKIPTANAIPLRRIFCRLCPACCIKPKIFSEITGKTHGIKFKMKPPRKPNSRNVKIPRAGAGRAESDADNLVCDPAGAALVICHAARSSPFGCCEKTTRPAIDDRFFGADSSGIRRTISLPFRD
jgi:hypothetical protein